MPEKMDKLDQGSDCFKQQQEDRARTAEIERAIREDAQRAQTIREQRNREEEGQGQK
ncbi:MAG: hypothetical protein ABSA96_20710 [Candidatus Acidiferrales bacterium]